MHDHLFIFRIVKCYTVWTWHREELDKPIRECWPKGMSLL